MTEHGQPDERRHRQNLFVSIASLTLGVVGVGGTLIALIINGLALRETARQTEYSRLSLVAVQRAFVTRDHSEQLLFADRFVFSPKWINYGNTPTVHAESQTVCNEESKFSIKEFVKIPIRLAPKQETAGADCILYPDVLNREYSWKLVVIYRIRYDDVFGGHHITSQCGILNIPPRINAAPMKFDGQECIAAMQKYNCVDDECAGTAATWGPDVPLSLNKFNDG